MTSDGILILAGMLLAVLLPIPHELVAALSPAPCDTGLRMGAGNDPALRQVRQLLAHVRGSYAPERQHGVQEAAN